MDIEQQIGYLVAKVEEQGADIRVMSEKLEALERRVNEKLQTAEATFRVLKWVGSTLVAALFIPWEKLTKLLGLGS